MIHPMQIIKSNTAREENKGKIHMNNRHRKSLGQNSTFLHDKSLEETRNSRNVPQHNKGHICIAPNGENPFLL
jgi:hypothetical protein